MTTRLSISRWMMFAAIVASVSLLGLSSAVFAADEGTPAAGELNGHDHPIHIHSGTCDTLGDVVFPLENLTADGAMATPMASEDDMATPAADHEGMDDHSEVVAASTTTITATFDDLTGSEHAINVHESAENIGNYIACGDISADNVSGDTLTVDLHEMNHSGFDGKAVIVDNGDGTLDVTVELRHTTMATAEASPEA